MRRVSRMPNPPTTSQTTIARHEQVRRGAYEIYEQRGREDGHETRRLAISRIGDSRPVHKEKNHGS